MTTVKFPKEDLLELLDYESGETKEDYKVISNELWDNGRWTLTYKLLFKHKNKVYQTFYGVGATEYQDERPWQYDGEMIDCTEMERVEKTVFVYEPKKASTDSVKA